MAKKNDIELKAMAENIRAEINDDMVNPCIINGYIIMVKPVHSPDNKLTLEESVYRLLKDDLERGGDDG